MGAIVSMLDQILVRVNCRICGPSEVKVGQLIGKAVLACNSCGQDMRLDEEPLKSHLAMLADNATRIDARRKRSGYVVGPPGQRSVSQTELSRQSSYITGVAKKQITP